MVLDQEKQTLLNLIREQDYHVIDKIYLYARDLSEPKYEYLIRKCEDAEIQNLGNPNPLIESSNMMDDVYEDIDLFIFNLFIVNKFYFIVQLD